MSVTSERKFAVDMLRRAGNSSRNKHTGAVGDGLSNETNFVLRTLRYIRIFNVLNELRQLYSYYIFSS